MKSQVTQHNDLKKEFREACEALSSQSNWNKERLRRRTAALSALYLNQIITQKMYTGLLMTDELSKVPQELM